LCILCGDIAIRLGQDTSAQKTTNVGINGALNSDSEAILGTLGGLLETAQFTDTAGLAASTDPIDTTTLLTSMYNDGEAAPIFAVDDELTFSGQKGGRQLKEETLIITAGMTVQDLMTFFQQSLGIPDPAEGIGATSNLSPAEFPGMAMKTFVAAGDEGVIQIIGVPGTLNDVDISTSDLQLNGADLDLGFTKIQDANGESAILDFPVFDSLGEQVDVKMTAYLESRTASTATFRYIFESKEDSNLDSFLETGTVSFDGDGLVVNGSEAQFSIARGNSAADTLDISVDLSNLRGVSNGESSILGFGGQDGSGPGTLTNFVIDESGLIKGVFDNGIIRTLGQVALGRFSNPQGLLEAGQGSFRQGVASGEVQIVAPGTSGAGSIRAGSIELSNTDIGRNLVDLIIASTNYRGNARVISSIQQLVDELLVLGR